MIIELIEFDNNGRPFGAIINNNGSRSVWDIDYCKRDDCLYAHQSGGGAVRHSVDSGNHKYWAAAGIQVVTSSDGRNYEPAPEDCRLKELPEAYTGDIEEWAAMEETVYCSVCDDHLPDSSVCNHIWWDDEVGWWSTPDDRSV